MMVAIQIGAVPSVQVFYSSQSICIYHWLSKAQSRVHVYSWQDPFEAPPHGSQHLSNLPAMFWAFPPGSLPHSHLHSLSFLLADSCYWHFVPQRVQEDSVYIQPISALLQTPMFTHLMDLGGHLKRVQGDICLLILITFQTWQEFFRWASTCPILMHPSNFHEVVPLIGQVSIVLLPDHRAGPLATVQESVKTQT